MPTNSALRRNAQRGTYTLIAFVVLSAIEAITLHQNNTVFLGAAFGLLPWVHTICLQFGRDAVLGALIANCMIVAGIGVVAFFAHKERQWAHIAGIFLLGASGGVALIAPWGSNLGVLAQMFGSFLLYLAAQACAKLEKRKREGLA